MNACELFWDVCAEEIFKKLPQAAYICKKMKFEKFIVIQKNQKNTASW